MPTRASLPCRQPGCPQLLTASGFCPTHSKQIDRARGNSAARGYGSKWRKARAEYLAAHPYCVECSKAGEWTTATLVDHIIPHRGDDGLFWDRKNWQSLCDTHHNQKRQRESRGVIVQ